MKWSHVIVAIVFFVIGAAAVFFGVSRSCQDVSLKATTSGTSVGFALGVAGKADKPAAKPASAAVAPKITFRIEKAVNRHGSDIRDFEMKANEGYEACQKACEEEAQCKAFTFVKPGVQSTAARCWLKNTVPQAYADDTCISGVRI